MQLTWIQKMKAIHAVARYKHEVSLKMREDGSWYVGGVGLDRREGGCLCGGLQTGKTPEEAVHQWWDWATDPKFYLVTRDTDNRRRAVKWNGFMWEDVDEEK